MWWVGNSILDLARVMVYGTLGGALAVPLPSHGILTKAEHSAAPSPGTPTKPCVSPTRSERIAEPYLRHVRERFEVLRSSLSRDPFLTVRIAGENNTSSLGRGLARDQWADAYGKWGLQAWALVTGAIGDLSHKLKSDYPHRVTFGRVSGADAGPSNLVVWGANARNWDLPDGKFIDGAGQAAAMGYMKPGIFGVVTTPLRGPPGGILE